jgi:hypothetical protein
MQLSTPTFTQTRSQLLALETELQALLDDANVRNLHRVNDAIAAGRCRLINGGLISSCRVVTELVT